MASKTIVSLSTGARHGLEKYDLSSRTESRRLMLDQIKPLILTNNESPKIAQSLSSISWAKDLVVVVHSSPPRFEQNYTAAHFHERW